MNHIQAAEAAVRQKHGLGHDEIAGCAAVAARTVTVNEYDERDQRMVYHLDLAYSLIKRGSPADIEDGLNLLSDVTAELRGES